MREEQVAVVGMLHGSPVAIYLQRTGCAIQPFACRACVVCDYKLMKKRQPLHQLLVAYDLILGLANLVSVDVNV